MRRLSTRSWTLRGRNGRRAVRWIATASQVALPTRGLGLLLYLGDRSDLSGERRPARVPATRSRESRVYDDRLIIPSKHTVGALPIRCLASERPSRYGA